MVLKVYDNPATYSPTAYIASWKSIDRSVPFYYMQHFETPMTQDPMMKKFILDTYFFAINKIANSILLQKKLSLLAGREFSIVNPAVEHNVFFSRYCKKAMDEGVMKFT
ncbi:MAG: hypothetical protein QXZ12_08440 [Thermoplasmata archaeon]